VGRFTGCLACDGAVLSRAGFRGSDDRISLCHECDEVSGAGLVQAGEC